MDGNGTKLCGLKDLGLKLNLTGFAKLIWSVPS
jgi:hypothetical protein